MPTLYVENVPDDIYAAMKERARQNRSSIAAEVMTMLQEHFPTEAERQRRRAFFDRARQRAAVAGARLYPSTEDMQREDRDT